MMKTMIFGILLSLAQSAWAVTCPGGSAFELRRPSDNVPLGCIDDGGRFKVSSVTLNGVDYDWPDADGASNARLTTDGSGALSWTAGGGGDVTAAGDNTFTGTNDFQGPVTGISFPMELVSSGTFTTATSTGMVVTTNTDYLLKINYIQNASNGYPGMRFNGDSGSNYKWANQMSQSNGDFTTGQHAGDTQIEFLANTGYLITASYYGDFDVKFRTVQGDGTYVLVKHHSQGMTSSADTNNMVGGGRYDGASNLSHVEWNTSAGTMTGSWKLYKYN